MTKPKIYMSNPREVEAIRFQHWSDAIAISQWTKNAFYVPQGFEHHLRKDSEKDRSRGDVLDSAPAYLVVYTLDLAFRVDLGDWVVKTENGQFNAFKTDAFDQNFHLKA